MGTRPDPVNSIICWAIIQVCSKLEQLQNEQPGSLLQLPREFRQELLGQPFISEIDQIIRQSPLLTLPGHGSSSRLDDDSSATQTSINGEFLKVLKAFLNLIYEPVLVQEDLEAEIAIVRAVTLEVLLKDARLLRDVWRHIDASRAGDGARGPRSLGGHPPQGEISDARPGFSAMKMFERALEAPFEDLRLSTYLLRVMCGKNRYKHAEHVYNLLAVQRVKRAAAVGRGHGQILGLQEPRPDPSSSGNSLMQELLVGYLLLLHQLQHAALG